MLCIRKYWAIAMSNFHRRTIKIVTPMKAIENLIKNRQVSV
ncbi:hypothetical protein [Calothrix sp. NIES-3974]|nr:hypothetical protein [Calothrix sp. NIES-3974]